MAQLLRTRRTALLALASLSGCTLIDQRTFDPTAGIPPVRPKPPAPPTPLAPPLPGPPPLLSVRLPVQGGLPPGLRADIVRAVTASRARKATVAFDVVEITPGTQAGTEAAAVGQMIVAQGVPAARVSLSARPIPGVAHEIRLFVH